MNLGFFQKNFKKVVWITGASSGIGEALCYKFSELDAKLIITSRKLQELEKVKNKCKNPQDVEILVMDLSDLDQMNKLLDDYFQKSPTKKIDILVNNAGLSMRASCLEHSLEQDIYLMKVNFLSCVALTKVPFSLYPPLNLLFNSESSLK